MNGLEWTLQCTGETLLLVALEKTTQGLNGYPCRVIGAFSAPTFQVSTGGVDVRISTLLASIGVPTNLLGYAYLRTALTLLLEEPELGRCISRSLYPRVAQMHQASPSAVERAIRHAIGQTFVRGGGTAYRATLGRLASTAGDHPTNSEFLAQTAEHLRMGA